MRPVATLLLAGLALLPGPARAQKPADVEKAILEATNEYRVENKLAKLTPDETLIKIAQGHARALARADKFGDSGDDGHVLNGKNFGDRAKEGGYTFRYLAENVGWNRGFKGPAAKVMSDWKKSPLHRKNLLTAQVTDVGIGAAQGKSGRWYFVQMFGRPPARQVKIKVQLANRTKHTIRFQAGPTKGELKEGEKGILNLEQSQGKFKIRITWPDDKKATADLADRTKYAFVEKEKGVFEFVKVGDL
jgi:hypothetical protein